MNRAITLLIDVMVHLEIMIESRRVTRVHALRVIVQAMIIISRLRQVACLRTTDEAKQKGVELVLIHVEAWAIENVTALNKLVEGQENLDDEMAPLLSSVYRSIAAVKSCS